MIRLDPAVEDADVHARAGRTLECPLTVDARGQRVVESDAVDGVVRQ